MARTRDDLTNVDELSGLTKASVLMLTLDDDAAAILLKAMAPKIVEEITRELANLGEIPQKSRDKIVQEFYDLAIAQQWATRGGLGHAKAMLRQSLPADDAEAIIQQLTQQVRKKPFAFLQKAQTQNLLTFIQDEQPQTIALILSHLPYHKAAEVLAGLPSPRQIEVVKRVASMEQTSPEVISEVESDLEARLAGILTQSFDKIGGVDTVAEVLNLVDRTTEKGVMEGLETEDPDLVEEIRRLMFVFEDIILVDDKGVQDVLKEFENDELSIALKTASDDLKDKIFKNMSDRDAQLIKDDMESTGPVRINDVESVQQRIVDMVRRLEDAGEIIISGRSGDKELVV